MDKWTVWDWADTYTTNTEEKEGEMIWATMK